MRNIPEHIPFLPSPPLPFEVWLTAIVMAIIILLALSFFAFLGMRWMRTLSFPCAILALVNGLGHLAGMAVSGRLTPGTYSAPLLLASACYLLVRTHRLEQKS